MREKESTALEGELGDPERKTIAPPHSEGLNPDKGLRFSQAKGLQQSRAAFSLRKHTACPGCCPLWGRHLFVEAELLHTRLEMLEQLGALGMKTFLSIMYP